MTWIAGGLTRGGGEERGEEKEGGEEREKKEEKKKKYLGLLACYHVELDVV